MNDLERDLRQLLDRKAIEGSTAPRPPERVIRRSRRRQVGTVAISALSLVALVGVTVSGLRTVQREAPAPIPADLDPYSTGRYPIFERTATIEPFSITSPSNWYLVDQWPLTWPLAKRSGGTTCSGYLGDAIKGMTGPVGTSGTSGTEVCESPEPTANLPRTVPILRLSNRDPGLRLPICDFGGTEPELVSDDAVLQVSVDLEVLRRWDGTWSDYPSHLSESTQVTDGACGRGRYGQFFVEGIPYVAWIGFGPDASADDRAQVFESFSAMAIDGRPRDPEPETAAYVIAGDENAAGPWQLELRNQTDPGYMSNVRMDLVTGEGPGITLGSPITVPAAPIEQAGGDPVFGAVTKEAGSVVLRQESRLSPIPVQLIPLPPSMPFDFDLFVARNEMDAPAKAVALGPNGEQLGAGLAPLPSDAEVVTAEGNEPDLGVHWTLRLSGSVEDGDACIDFDTRIDFDPWCPFSFSSPDPVLSVWADQGRFFMVGSVPSGIDGVGFDGGSWRSGGECIDGPTGWGGRRGCVLPLLGLEDGSIVFSGDGGGLTWSLDRATRLLPINRVAGSSEATGEFLGFPWRIEEGFYKDGIDVEVDGAAKTIERPVLDDSVVFSFPRSEFQALLLILTDTSVDQVDVASEGRWFGRWMQSSTRDGDEARLWVVELPGEGSGALSYDGKNVGSVSWP